MRNNLRKIRAEAGSTQSWVARQIGVSPVLIRMWEKGEAKPNSDQIRRLEKVYGVGQIDVST